MSQKIFDNDLITISKSKVTLTFNKPADIGIFILDLSKVLMCELHYDYIKNKLQLNYYNSRLLFTGTNSFMYEIEIENYNFNKDKEIIYFINYSSKSKCFDDSNKLVVDKMKK